MTISAGRFRVGVGLAAPDYSTLSAFEADIVGTGLTGPMWCELMDQAHAGQNFTGWDTSGHMFTLMAADGAKAMPNMLRTNARFEHSAGTGFSSVTFFDGVDHITIRDLKFFNLVDSGNVHGARWDHDVYATGMTFLMENCIAGRPIEAGVGPNASTTGRIATFDSGSGEDLADLDVGAIQINNCITLRGRTVTGASGATDRQVVNHCASWLQNEDNGNTTSNYTLNECHNCLSWFFGPSSGHADFLNLDASSTNNAGHDLSDQGNNDLQGPFTPEDHFRGLGGTNFDFRPRNNPLTRSAGGPQGAANAPLDFFGLPRDPNTPTLGPIEYVEYEKFKLMMPG